MEQSLDEGLLIPGCQSGHRVPLYGLEGGLLRAGDNEIGQGASGQFGGPAQEVFLFRGDSGLQALESGPGRGCAVEHDTTLSYTVRQMAVRFNCPIPW
jgi:hypothetical protein